MKKFLLLFFTISFIISSFAKADPCPDQVLEQLHDYLKPKLSKVTWLDVNSSDALDTCQFVIRYYPCTDDIQKQIDRLLPQAIQAKAPQCVLENSGVHEHTEGFCTLTQTEMRCE